MDKLSRERLQEIESGKVQLKSIHVNGVLTPEAQAIADPMFKAAQEAARPMIDSIRASRRITAKDMAWTANVQDDD